MDGERLIMAREAKKIYAEEFMKRVEKICTSLERQSSKHRMRNPFWLRVRLMMERTGNWQKAPKMRSHKRVLPEGHKKVTITEGGLKVVLKKREEPILKE